MPTIVADITREHVAVFVIHLLDTKAASTANTRYRGLQRFFRWLLEGDAIDQSPMEHMTPPQIPESESDVLTEEELRRLLKACAGKTFEDRRDLERYLRERANHRHADSAMLWLGRRGPMTGWGIYQVVQRRAMLAGIENLHPHRFRHTFAHRWLAHGGQEGDLMRLAGWQSRTMLARYSASAADERARDAYRTLSLRDRL